MAKKSECDPFLKYFAAAFKLPSQFGACPLKVDARRHRISVISSRRYEYQLRFNQLLILAIYPVILCGAPISVALAIAGTLPLMVAAIICLALVGLIFYHAMNSFFHRDKYELSVLLNGVLTALNRVSRM